MIATIWFVLIGLLFVGMALAGSVVKRLPLTAAILYLAFGFGLAKYAPQLLSVDPLEHIDLIERIAEVAVLISLFSAGLKLRAPFRARRWRNPVRLATISMLITVALITLLGMYGLSLPLGAAVLLAAMIAPTDPVLASDVQVEDPGDRDRLRFSLTGEAGLNDGTAFPMVMLGLGLLGAHELGTAGWRWLAIDVVWSIGAGLAIGWAMGAMVGRLVVYLRREHKEATGLDDFLALGLIALSYGVALLAHSYGFLAVFAAGLALRRVETRATGMLPAHEVRQLATSGSAEEVATDPQAGAAYMTETVLGFNEQLERIGEVVVVVLIGALLTTVAPIPQLLWFIPLVLLVIRPLAVAIGLLGATLSGEQRWLTSWFGIRGIGSIYYLAYAIAHGLPNDLAQTLLSVVLYMVAISVVVHGISVTPLMRRYTERHTNNTNKSLGMR